MAALLSDVMRRRMAERSYTMRSLAEKTRELDDRGRGLSHGYLASLAKGSRLEVPGVDAIELIAEALGVSPAEILEYQLALVRRELDPREVGRDRAQAALAAVWPAVGPLVLSDADLFGQAIATAAEEFEAGSAAPDEGHDSTGRAGTQEARRR